MPEYARGDVKASIWSVFYFVFKGNFQLQAPRGGGGAYIWRGDLTEGFGGGLYLEGIIQGGAYFRNFTVA